MIHGLPGMGADERMYLQAWCRIDGFVVHSWPQYAGEQSLTAVAQKLCIAHGIKDGDDLVGTSLGGMVACEITKLRKIARLFLVGSAQQKEEINGLLQALHPLAQVAPISWLQFSAEKVPSELTQMFSESDPAFIRAMCRAIFDWEGLGETTTKVYRIHGRRDVVIPPPRQADLLLEGGHLIAMTHAEECAEFVRRNVED